MLSSVASNSSHGHTKKSMNDEDPSSTLTMCCSDSAPSAFVRSCVFDATWSAFTEGLKMLNLYLQEQEGSRSQTSPNETLCAALHYLSHAHLLSCV